MTQGASCKPVRMPRRDMQIANAIEAGVSPLALYYSQINGCDTNSPLAYRTSAIIDSTVLGRLTPQDYMRSLEHSEIGVKLAEWSVREAMTHIDRFVEAERSIEWISVKCPISLVTQVDIHTWMKQLMQDHNFKHPQKLCLEFSEELLFQDTDKARLAVLDLRLLGVKTLLSGCASDNCPLSRLTSIPVDMVLLTPEVTKLCLDRNKPNVFPALVTYLLSMRTAVYAENALNDEQIRFLSRSGCEGYTVGKEYVGKTGAKWKLLSFDVALAQKNTEDGDFDEF